MSNFQKIQEKPPEEIFESAVNFIEIKLLIWNYSTVINLTTTLHLTPAAKMRTTTLH